MSIFIKELSDNKFEITINKKLITKHTVLLTDEYHYILTEKKIYLYTGVLKNIPNEKN